ncbi:MAG: lipid A-modifier LpxR family protein [Bacteroidota bacterium]
MNPAKSRGGRISFFLFVFSLLLSTSVMSQPCTGFTIEDVDVSSKRILDIYYDNDRFGGTNRYYTEGWGVKLITPRFKNLFLSRLLLLRVGRRPRTFYGLQLSHAAFTPDNILATEVVEGDRPYARQTVFTHSLISNDLQRNMRLTTEFDLGFIGPFATAGLYRTESFRSNGPVGWQNQIRTDVVVGYRARFEKGLLSTNGVDVVAYGDAGLSTLRTFGGVGAIIRLGLINPYFYDLYVDQRSIYGSRDIRPIEVYLKIDAGAHAIGYDATLQGGLINRNSPYTLSGSEIQRFTFDGNAGIYIFIKRFGINYIHNLQTATFKEGETHNWGRIQAIFVF